MGDGNVELDFAALEVEVSGYTRRLDEIYNKLRTAGHAYAWAAACTARDCLDDLVEQLQSDRGVESPHGALRPSS